MADTVVVLVSSDDDDDLPSQRKTSAFSSNTKSNKRASPQATKRKLPIDDEEPSSKKNATYQEELTTVRNFTDQHLGALLPMITKVETLATPSATPPLQLLASPPRNTAAPAEKNAFDGEVGSPISEKAEKSEKAVKRVKLTTLVKGTDDSWQNLRQKRLASASSFHSSSQPSTPIPSEEVVVTADCTTLPAIDLTCTAPNNEISIEKDESESSDSKEKLIPLLREKRPPLEKEYEEMISECRKADPSPDMEKLIETKLLKYYYSVHPDFVKSRGFRKNVLNATERIRAEPDLVYYNVKAVVDELNVRRKSKDVVITNDQTATGTSSGVQVMPDKHTEEQIKKLNRALYILKKRIAKLEEAEVDWEDEDSAYLQVERFKKRACQIYEKICDLTGESKNAHRVVKKPIQFNGTSYSVFNKTLQAYINKTKEFPDYYDVLRMLEHCNRHHDLKLASFEVKRIAQDAFIKVGKSLQARRKNDLYETVAHFTANATDPAASDPTLLAKLKENERSRTKISDVIEKYARAQDDPDTAAELINEVLNKPSREDSEENSKPASENEKNGLPSDDSDDNEDEDDDENLDVHVEKLTQDSTVDISDVDSDNEVNEKEKPTTNEAASVKANDVNKSNIKENSFNEKEHEMQRKGTVKLTENNNIMRTKTIESNVKAKEPIGGIALHKTTSTLTMTAITSTPGQRKSSDVVVSSMNTNKACSDVLAKTVKTAVTSSKSSSNPSKHRTIAEIVISDEE